MRLRVLAKEAVERLPESVARRLVWVPFSIRLGLQYGIWRKRLKRYEHPTADWESELLNSLRRVLADAIRHVEFWRELAERHGFSARDIRSLEDWRHLPVVTKKELQDCQLEFRCSRPERGMRLNTGGTVGEPLEFLVDNRAFAREWAHMHHLWMKRGYRTSDVKLTLRGKYFDTSDVLRFNAVHNEYVVNSNAPMSAVVHAVARLPRGRDLRWIHGYPSLVAEFAHELRERDPALTTRLRRQLKGVLLGSEYPAPIYREPIEAVLSTNSVTWYGHSEMAILAVESAAGVYTSLPTYGFAEAVPEADGQAWRLVGTSLHNRTHPFIRYDTGDRIRPIHSEAGVLTFRIEEGRLGDFIHDRDGNRHSLTAVMFGRHHPAFRLIRHVQVRETAPGEIALLITPKDLDCDVGTLREGFKLEGLNMTWNLQILDAPVRTTAGKIRLKV